MSTDFKTAVALGSFDGLHKGHISVITCALSFKERGFVPLVLLFDKHPLLSLTGKAPAELLQVEERNRILSELGTKIKVISFDSVRNLPCRDFVKNILVDELKAGAVCCGWNFRFGKNNAGGCEELQKLCDEFGLELCVSDHIDVDGQPVSSSRIRRAIVDGNIPLANAMLGRDFGYKYTVVTGSQRGHLMGAPTINQYFGENFIIPKSGVYASYSIVNGKNYPSVTNIGLRPSFENEDLRSETCIIAFSGNLYGKEIEVRLLEFIRPERKFESSDELRRQIALDAKKSEEIFKKKEANGNVR